MHIHSPRTILAASAALALTVSALAPTAAFARGPGSGGCDGDCTNEQPPAQQGVRARDGSAQQAETRANAGAGQQVQVRAGKGGAQDQNGRFADQNTNRNGKNANQKWAVGRGQDDDAQRGPGNCEDCDIEMGTLTDDQKAGLAFMANEEKLAEDVYTAFADLYDLPVFGRIADSEVQHQVAVDAIMKRYGVENPALDLADGQFSDISIAALYTELVAKGSASLEDALAVGLLIEETDIADLIERMGELEETAPDVYNMYSHLLAGSQNHLAAFQRQS